MKSISCLLPALALLIASGCKNEPATNTNAGGPKSGGAPNSFDAVVAAEYAFDRNINVPGNILPSENTDLHPEVNGRVVRINFNEGSYVSKGSLLVKLFDDDLQAQLKKLEVQLKVSEATERRQKELLAINGTSQQDYDVANLTVSNIKADIELMKVNIARTEIRAPFNGRLGLRNISLGAYVTPSTIITNIAQVNSVKVEFSVSEKYASEMVAGKKVILRPTSTRKTYTATIIAAQNSISSETRNLAVRAIVSNADGNLAPGSFVEVNVAVGNGKPAIMIPSQAVMPSTRYKNVIVSQQGKATFKVVETGARDSARIEITNGIQVGDTIIINGLLTIKEGMNIKAVVKPNN
ncbi:MAG TPA: efflux RND transporter periplasmic adaptor subunit [Phnomibacter sp.]|nr:efflux RND transporter periplasmic adaptor subunit [Phnomibacter sp.]